MCVIHLQWTVAKGLPGALTMQTFEFDQGCGCVVNFQRRS